jgi:hypothetical protein
VTETLADGAHQPQGGGSYRHPANAGNRPDRVRVRIGPAARTAGRLRSVPVLPKPCLPDTLAGAIRRLLLLRSAWRKRQLRAQPPVWKKKDTA